MISARWLAGGRTWEEKKQKEKEPIRRGKQKKQKHSNDEKSRPGKEGEKKLELSG